MRQGEGMLSLKWSRVGREHGMMPGRGGRSMVCEVRHGMVQGLESSVTRDRAANR